MGLHAGESIELRQAYKDPKTSLPLCPLPGTSVKVKVLSEDEATTHLIETSMDLVTLDGGTSSGGNTDSALKDSTKNWPVNKFKDKCIKITNGQGVGQERRIKSNTATELTLYAESASTDAPTALRKWATTPDNTSVYQVHEAEYKKTWDSPTSLKDTVVKQVVTAKDPAYPNGVVSKTRLHLEGTT